MPYVWTRAWESTMLIDSHFVMSKGSDSTRRNSQYACGCATTIVGISRAKPPSTKASFANESADSAMLVATATNIPTPTTPKPVPSLSEIVGRTLFPSTQFFTAKRLPRAGDLQPVLNQAIGGDWP